MTGEAEEEYVPQVRRDLMIIKVCSENVYVLFYSCAVSDLMSEQNTKKLKIEIEKTEQSIFVAKKARLNVHGMM